ncbi:MAG: winged helix-turn-helix domain-containing protein [Candidatus Bathyarchaeota archaeon]|nr:winged helix-turn-helix domain-containing protein [Candidatus Bathyarchaeota archaeon]
MKERERDLMRKIMLELLMKGYVHWTDLKKRALGSCFPFATDATFARQMRYLLACGFIEKRSRGVYAITDKGKQYLKILT